jgi:hypothetical protein
MFSFNEKPRLTAESAQALATEARRRSGHRPGEPVDLLKLCELGGFQIRERRLSAADGGRQAALVPAARSDRFVIEIDAEPPGGWDLVPAGEREALARHRQRFRLGHELAHSYFYTRRPGQGPRRRVAGSARLEAFCDEYARALLIPPQAAARFAPTAQAIFTLQRRYDTSLELAARALAMAHPAARIALWWWPADAEPGEQLLRQWNNLDGLELVRAWRQSGLVAEAQRGGLASGTLPTAAGPVAASARMQRARRQLVAVAGA